MTHLKQIRGWFEQYTAELIELGCSKEEAEETWAREYASEIALLLNRNSETMLEAFMETLNAELECNI